MEKRYYWLKLYDDFFGSKRIKKMRKLAGGDTLTIIYLKMQLKAIKSGGVLTWTGVEDNFAAELALDLDETPENVALLITYLLSCGLCELSDDERELYLPFAVANTGSEGSSAQRMRDKRNRERTELNEVRTLCEHRYGEKEIEKEIEIDIEKDIDSRAKRKRFTPPTLEEVKQYCSERGNKVNAEEWFDYYTACDFKVGKNKKMSDWKASVRYWERNEYGHSKSGSSEVQSSRDWGVHAGVRRGVEQEDL